MEALKLRQGQLHFFKWNHVFFFWMTLLSILRRIQRPTTQGHSSHAKYENSRKIIFISYDTHDNTHRHITLKMNDFQEYFDMLMVLGECRKHYRNTQDLYAAGYTDRQHKSHIAFKRLADRFCRFGTVKQRRVKR